MDPLHFFYIFKFLGISDELILSSHLTLSNQPPYQQRLNLVRPLAL